MKSRLLLIAFLGLAILLAGVSADDFVIGAYSQYQLNHAKQTGAVFDDLAGYLDAAGYNTILYSMKYDEVKQGKLAEALAALSQYKIGSIIDDWAWQENGPVGVTPMAYGNYLKLEAEYLLDYEEGRFVVDQLPVDDSADDRMNYVFRHDTGRRSDHDPSAHSNGYAWICDEKENHHADLALAEPRFRWKPEDKADSRLLGYDFKFFPNARENLLYLRVALNFRGLEPGDKVAEIRLKVLNANLLDSRTNEFGRYPESSYIELPLKSVLPQLYDTTIVNKDYSGVPFDPRFNNHIFEFYAELPPPGSQLFKDTIRHEFFYHINPQVYWHGKGRLVLDYIELEDELHRALAYTSKTPHPLMLRLQERLDQIDLQPGAENILYFYGKDEPFQGQFSAYDKLESYLNAQGKKLITATHLENIGYKKPDGLPDYSHYGLFLQTAKPEVVMLDAYPLQEWGPGPGALIRWNKDLQHPLFVQNKIDSVLLDNYHFLARTIKRNPEYRDTRLFYVPQTYGEKYDPVETAEWRYFMPPRSMQKCLQLLPLCYAADGIVDFAITANRDQSFAAGGNRTYRRVTPLHHAGDYTKLTLEPGETAYTQLSEANAKIRVYGPLLRKLNWVDADSIMVKGSHPKLDLPRLKLSALEVLPGGEGHYEGYVQCGYYTDAEGLPSFMLVNRRAVYKLEDAPNVTPWDVDAYFVDAKPQTLRFSLDQKASQAARYALVDPFSKQVYPALNGNIDVSLAAGDGILLQLVGILPSKVAGSRTLKAQEIISGNMVVTKKSSLVFDSNSELQILSGSVITVEKGAELRLEGTTRFQDKVKIILKPGSRFIFNENTIHFADDTQIQQKKSCWLKRLFGG